jgi:protein-tyrosine phosphatase
MDMSNKDDLQAICPSGLEDKIHLFLKFSDNTSAKEVPDPYYGGINGFETVLDLIEDAADGLITHLQKHHSI